MSWLNPDAAEFSFNPGASSFEPAGSFGAETQPPEPEPMQGPYVDPEFAFKVYPTSSPESWPPTCWTDGSLWYNNDGVPINIHSTPMTWEEFWEECQRMNEQNQQAEEGSSDDEGTMTLDEYLNKKGKTSKKSIPLTGFGKKVVSVGSDKSAQPRAPPKPAKPQAFKPMPPKKKPEKPKDKPVTEKAVNKDQLLNRQKEKTMSDVVEESKISEPDNQRAPVNIVFIGHVDAGKSTICGNVLLSTGKIDRRIVEAYEAEAKEKGRDSWWLAYIMDESEEERAKGKTVEVGRAFFETPSKRFTILDAPGHKSYVPNMIGGASQADYAALVVSARIGEFETGFERGGQTQEHTLLARSLGVDKLIVVINKMDDHSVEWSKDRYDQIKSTLVPFLKDSCKFDVDKDVHWVPISGLNGDNIVTKSENPQSNWYEGPTLMEILESLELPKRGSEEPLRIPILDKSKEQGLVCYGKVESGKIVRGLKVIIMPSKVKAEVQEVYGAADTRLLYANAGENIRLRLKLFEEVEVQKGFVICDVHDVCHIGSEFKADVQFLDLLEGKQIITAGYQCVMHIHTAIEECQVTEVLAVIDTERRKKVKSAFARAHQRVILKIRCSESVCVENFTKMQQLGRFTLRDEGRTIALGKVMDVDPVAEALVSEMGI